MHLVDVQLHVAPLSQALVFWSPTPEAVSESYLKAQQQVHAAVAQGCTYRPQAFGIL